MDSRNLAPFYTLTNGIQIRMILNKGFYDRMMPHYQICSCGAWNHWFDNWFQTTFGNHCYMCKTPIWVLPENIQQALSLLGVDDGQS